MIFEYTEGHTTRTFTLTHVAIDTDDDHVTCPWPRCHAENDVDAIRCLLCHRYLSTRHYVPHSFNAGPTADEYVRIYQTYLSKDA